MSQALDPKSAAKVVARAWVDGAFHERLRTSPHAALREAGIDLPSNVHVHVHHASAQEVHLVIPPRPASLEAHVKKGDVDPAFCTASGPGHADPAFCTALAHPEFCVVCACAH